MNRRWLAVGIIALMVLVGGFFGIRVLTQNDPVRSGSGPVLATADVPSANGAETIETVASGTETAPTGGTPMAQRVAVLGLLNKRNGESRDVTLKPGQATRLGDVVIRLRACEQTAPWEPEQLTGAFAQVFVRGIDAKWRRVFSGWLYRERPGLNVVQHPIYDVWTKSCTMSWPDKGPDTTVLSAPAAAGRSSAKKSPAASDAPATAEPTIPSSEAESNAT